MAPTSELVVPDEIITPGAEAPAWDEPCAHCGEAWSAGPERDRWGRQHCWRCGYAPGQNVHAIPGAGPAQPDWARLVQEAVTNALRSEPQALAEAMTAALGREGLADLARQQQESLGMAPGQASPFAPPAPGSGD